MSSNTSTVHSSFWANFFNPPSEKTDIIQTLNSTPPFKHLSKRDCSLLLNIIHNRNYVAGEYIFYEGDPGLGMYIIREGEVKIVKTTSNGDLKDLALFKKGDFFGELALIDGEKRSASAIAKTNTKLLVIFKPDLDEFVTKFPKKGLKILKGISQIIALRLRKLNDDHFELLEKCKFEGELL